MANVAHSTITDPNLHEPKGVASAAANEVYLADGAGSGDWFKEHAYGSWRYADLSTGTTFTGPTTYTLMNVVGVDGALSEFTNNDLGRLTYTGVPTRKVRVSVDITFKHSAGTQDVYFDIFKGGVTAGSEIAMNVPGTGFMHVNLNFDLSMATNDYIEVYLKTASGNVVVHSAYLAALAINP